MHEKVDKLERLLDHIVMEESGSEQEVVLNRSTEVKAQMELKEPPKAAAEYRMILAACFDNKGQPKKDKYLTSHLFRPFTNEKLAYSVQASLLGLRPLFVVDEINSEIFQQLPEFSRRFSIFDKSKDLKKYHSTASFVFDPNQVEQVLIQNSDLFTNYSHEQPIGEYLAGQVEAEMFMGENELNEPHAVLDMVNPQNPKQELSEPFYFPFARDPERSHEVWPLQRARIQALRLGVLLGYPREFLERSLDRQWETHVDYYKRYHHWEPVSIHTDYSNVGHGKLFVFTDKEMSEEGKQFKEKVERAFKDSGVESVHTKYTQQYGNRRRSPLAKVAKAVFGQ